ncbi:MAG TPA: DUF72 domain-containing protein [Sphingomicrobium sp.]|nr:DUF72 domain-containing protein [Sphingomicrobium sp.]
MPELRIGTAGWTIPREVGDRFPPDGTTLERYSQTLTCAEINSSFHRPHRASTWQRWRDSVPDDFRFSVKLPKTITHQHRLLDCTEPLVAFLKEANGLGDKLGVLLVQLPPSLAFASKVASAFFADLRSRTAVPITCEPRHPTWFDQPADCMLAEWQVARVAADPARVPAAADSGGWQGLSYWRLHGSPIMYRSSYSDRIDHYANRIAEDHIASASWCILDNTASSAALPDALSLHEAMSRRTRSG